MGHLYYSPIWFLGYDVALEILFGLITLVVAYYAFKIYKLSGQRELKLFGYSFSLISLSYFAWAMLNLFVISKLTSNCILEIHGLSIFATLGVYIHILLYMAGLIVLTYTTLKIKDSRVLFLLFFLVFLATFFMTAKGIVIYLISSILLLFVILYYLDDYIRKKNNKSFLVLVAFIFLFIGRFDFLFAARNELSYVLGHLFELFSYVLIFMSLALSLKNGKEKKSFRDN